MRFIKWIALKVVAPLYIKSVVNDTIERCAALCDKNAKEADDMYWVLKAIASDENDFGVLKFAAWSGQAGRDANAIRGLKKNA